MTQPTRFEMPLLSERKFAVCSEPFVYGYVDDFLPTDLYERLERDFPSPELFPGLEELPGGKQYRKFWRGDPMDDLEHVSEPWREWIAFINSDRFVEDCGRWCSEFVTPYRKAATARSPLKLLGDRPDIRNWDIDLNCEFSVLPRDAHLPPHTDSTDKVLTFMLYFPQLNWDPGWGGGTQIYQPLDKQHLSNWSNRPLPRAHADLVFENEFRPNRLFFFAKAANSYHGVEAIKCPAEIPRRSFNFAFVIPRERTQNVVHALKERFVRKIESQRFKSAKRSDKNREKGRA